MKAGKEAIVSNNIDPHMLSISNNARAVESRKGFALAQPQYRLKQLQDFRK